MSTADDLQKLVTQADEVIIFIGNPGTGKSTMVNCYTGKHLFEAKASLDGTGITKFLNAVPLGKTVFMDTPGLSDVKLRKAAGHAIQTAFKMGGRFKPLFVLTTEEGRIKSDDSTTLSLVLQAINEEEDQIKDGQYSILVNKCDEDWLKLMDGPGNKEVWIETLMEVLTASNNPTTKSVFFAPRLKQLSSKTDVVLDLGEELNKFIRDAPMVVVKGDKVGDVNTDSFEEVAEKNAALEQEVKAANAAQKAAEEQRVIAEEQRAKAEEHKRIAEGEAAKAKQAAHSSDLKAKEALDKQKKAMEEAYAFERKEKEARAAEAKARSEAQRAQQEVESARRKAKEDLENQRRENARQLDLAKQTAMAKQTSQTNTKQTTKKVTNTRCKTCGGTAQVTCSKCSGEGHIYVHSAADAVGQTAAGFFTLGIYTAIRGATTGGRGHGTHPEECRKCEGKGKHKCEKGCNNGWFQSVKQS